MSIFKEVALAVPALVVCLLISHALFGSDQPEPVKPSVAIGSTWIGADALPAERWLAKDSFVTGGPRMTADRTPGEHRLATAATPHARIKGVFAQFVPGEGGRAI